MPAPAVDEQHSAAHEETAVLAGGCFWGVQTSLNRDQGREAYGGGLLGRDEGDGELRGCVERDDRACGALKMVFDPQKISYGTMLRMFFSVVHDPTQLNRQGPDVGTSYRSVIFYASPEQERLRRPTLRSWMRRMCFRRRL